MTATARAIAWTFIVWMASGMSILVAGDRRIWAIITISSSEAEIVAAATGEITIEITDITTLATGAEAECHAACSSRVSMGKEC